MTYSKEEVMKMADNLEQCSNPKTACKGCAYDQRCNGDEPGSAIMQDAAKMLRALMDALTYKTTVVSHMKELADNHSAAKSGATEGITKGQEWQLGLYERAIEKYGEEAQIKKAVEELGELIVELAKALNGSKDEHQLGHLREELADVCIMCDQLQLIFGDVSDWEMYKLERLERKLVMGL